MHKKYIDLRNEGLSYAAIGRKFNISRQAVWDKINRHNKKVDRIEKLECFSEEILKLYDEGASISSISRKIKISRHLIERKVSEYRSGNRSKIKHRATISIYCSAEEKEKLIKEAEKNNTFLSKHVLKIVRKHIEELSF